MGKWTDIDTFVDYLDQNVNKFFLTLLQVLACSVILIARRVLALILFMLKNWSRDFYESK